MALRTIREFGDEVLNKECKEVTKMTLRTKVLINDMLDTMYEAMGVGLASPPTRTAAPSTSATNCQLTKP